MTDPLAALFGSVVRRRREAAGLSQEQLGERTNLSRNYVGMVERGEASPTLRVVQSLAEALGTTMVSLVREVEATSGD